MTETRTCTWCKSTIERSPSQFVNQRTKQEYNRHFCDRTCRGSWEAEHNTGPNNQNFKGGKVEVRCSWCNSPKRVKPHKAERRENHFCDRSCMGKWFSHNRRGENHHLWKGGPVGYYGHRWTEARRKARERDDFACVHCGMTDADHKDTFGRELAVHHIRPIPPDTEDPSQYHELDNLKTLCRPCHRREHRATTDNETMSQQQQIPEPDTNDATGLDYEPKRNPENGREQLPNPERGCGYLKKGKAYVRSDLSRDGDVPAFVSFPTPIPYKEGTLRSYEYIDGDALELAVSHNFPTSPEGEIHRHLERIQGVDDGGHFGEMDFAYSQHLLQWVGATYYGEPEDFVKEMKAFGLSKAIPVSKKQAPPKIIPGVTKVYLIHPNAVKVWGDNDPNDPDAEPEDEVPGIVGYAYLTRVVWTVPADGKIPKWAKAYNDHGTMDIAEVGEQVDADEHGLDDWEPGDDVPDRLLDAAGEASPLHRDDPDTPASTDDAPDAPSDTDDTPAEESPTEQSEADSDDSDATDGEPDTLVPSPRHNQDVVAIGDLTYNELKSVARDVGADVSAQPSKDELVDGIKAAMDEQNE